MIHRARFNGHAALVVVVALVVCTSSVVHGLPCMTMSFSDMPSIANCMTGCAVDEDGQGPLKMTLRLNDDVLDVDLNPPTSAFLTKHHALPFISSFTVDDKSFQLMFKQSPAVHCPVWHQLFDAQQSRRDSNKLIKAMQKRWKHSISPEELLRNLRVEFTQSLANDNLP